MMNEGELLELKQKIDEAKSESLKLEGQKRAILEQLKKDWDCSSLKEAKAKMREMEGQIKDLSDQIDKGIKEIEEKWDF